MINWLRRKHPVIQGIILAAPLALLIWGLHEIFDHIRQRNIIARDQELVRDCMLANLTPYQCYFVRKYILQWGDDA